ncbi:MAG: hypothetical protein ACYC67_25400 [Prosthecobacter sp.]
MREADTSNCQRLRCSMLDARCSMLDARCSMLVACSAFGYAMIEDEQENEHEDEDELNILH